MADRYQDRPFPSRGDYDRGGNPRPSARGESDPLAELARLIGQTDPFGSTGRANQQVPPRTTARDPYQQQRPVDQQPRPVDQEPRPVEPDDVGPPAGPPPWLQRANRQEIPQQEVPQQESPPEYPSAVHPVQRYGTARAAPEPDYEQEPLQRRASARAAPEPDYEQEPPPQRRAPARAAPEPDFGQEPPLPRRAAARGAPEPDYGQEPLPRRAAARGAPEPDYGQEPLPRRATARGAPEPDYEQEPPPYADDDREPDPSRYDDALYGQLNAGSQQHGQAYADDTYAFQDGYDDGPEEEVQKRRGGMVTLVVVLALAVVGTGAAFAYRTYVGTPRSGEPPIIRADTSPTKVVPAPSDGTAKLPDRLAASDGTEKIVPREEAPVDINAKVGPRVVFPALNQNGNPPSAASVAPGNQPLVSGGNGTLSNSEPRKIRTLTVHGDQPDGAAVPVATPAAAAKPAVAARTAAAQASAAPRNPPTSANASANAPMSLVPQANQAVPAEPRTRVANTSTSPVQPAPAGGGGYVVQVSSQRNEADAQTSYRALQGKFPAVLGSHEPLIKRADLGEKGIYYRAMVGPFGTSEEAVQLCGNLKSAGGQCVVQKN